MSEDEPSHLEGHLVTRGASTAILRYPLSTALPIPLAVAAPAGIRLVTWAFAGLDAADPHGLLVLALDEEASLGASLRLVTHFRAVDIALRAAGDALAPDERALVARALLAAASPDETAALADLIGLLGEAIATFAPDDEAPVLAHAGDGWRLSGTDVPGHLLLRAEHAWSCHRVARASLHFGGTRITSGAGSQDEGAGGKAVDSARPQAHLILESAWGETPAACPTHAIGLTADGFTPYRIA